jgi:formylglycine-generating enzyme required for sulfatase activity
MTKALRNLGFQLIGCGGADSCLDATRDGMQEAIRELGRRLNAHPGAIAFFYFSGHGAQARSRPDAMEENFLVPVGSGVREEFEMSYKTVPVQEVVDMMNSVGVEAGIVVIDACRDNLLRPSDKSGSPKGMASSTAAPSLLIAYAAEPGHVALESIRGSTLSPYARRLSENLVIPGKSIVKVFFDVRRQVIDDTGGQQKPDMIARLSDDLYLAGSASPANGLPPAAPPPGGAVVTPAVPTARTSPRAGSSFYDCAVCPEMVWVPPGSFQRAWYQPPPPAPKPTTWSRIRDFLGLGSGSTDQGSPEHTLVTINYSFSVTKYPVTRGDWQQYLESSQHPASKGCRSFDGQLLAGGNGSWKTPGYVQENDNHPVVCVTWQEAQDYAAWLTGKTGHHYRLLSEEEHEYVNRAGATTDYGWGTDVYAVCDRVNSRGGPEREVTENSGDGDTRTTTVPGCDDGYPHTSPVYHFPANAFGLHDTTGNVWSWTLDCQHDSYRGEPADGSPWGDAQCDTRMLRGGAWDIRGKDLTLTHWGWAPARGAYNTVGLRLLRTAD